MEANKECEKEQTRAFRSGPSLLSSKDFSGKQYSMGNKVCRGEKQKRNPAVKDEAECLYFCGTIFGVRGERERKYWLEMYKWSEFGHTFCPPSPGQFSSRNRSKRTAYRHIFSISPPPPLVLLFLLLSTVLSSLANPIFDFERMETVDDNANLARGGCQPKSNPNSKLSARVATKLLEVRLSPSHGKLLTLITSNSLPRTPARAERGREIKD